MEALAAVSLAGNVLQFVKLALSIVSTTASLKRSNDGRLKEHKELHLVTEDLSYRMAQLGTVQDQKLQELVNTCIDVGADLKAVLKKAEAKTSNNGNRNGKSRLWSSFKQALLSEWHQKDIDGAESRLLAVRDAMSFHLQSLDRKAIGDLLQRSISTQDQLSEIKDSVDSIPSDMLAQSQSSYQEIHSMLGEVRDLVKSNISRPSTPSNGNARAPSRRNFLNTLEFRGMNQREEKISRTHARTYQWLLMESSAPRRLASHKCSYDKERERSKQALRDTCAKLGIKSEGEDPFSLRNMDRCPSAHLQNWLASGEGLFWIWGKPGCGKSTLMKALVQTSVMKQRHEQLIASWANNDNVITAKFFFFRTGIVDFQKTHLGFLQSILYQILTQEPSLIDSTFSEREQHEALARLKATSGADTPIWDVSELQHAFQNWRKNSSSKLYLHVDGLDEMAEKTTDIAEILHNVADQGNIKILVASRWDPDFEHLFNRQQSLALHKTTELDILTYTVDKLNQDCVLSLLDDRSVQFVQLVKEVVDAAQGVFLWVRIVLDSLTRGATRFETFEQLLDRLHEYPKELDKLYGFLFRSIDNRYLNDAAIWLLTMRLAARLQKSSRTGGNVSKMLAPIPNEYSIIVTTEQMRGVERYDLDDPLSLLNVQLEQANVLGKDIDTLQKRMQAQCLHLFDFSKTRAGIRINLSHRTVLDFLEQPEVLLYLQEFLPSHKQLSVALFAVRLRRTFEIREQDDHKVVFFPEGFPVVRLASFFDKLDGITARKLWAQVQEVLKRSTWRKDIDKCGLMPTKQGWFCAHEMYHLRQLCDHPFSFAHFCARYKITRFLEQSVQDADLSSEDIGQLIIEWPWCFAGSQHGSNRYYLPRLKLSGLSCGISGLNLALKRVLDWVRVCANLTASDFETVEFWTFKWALDSIEHLILHGADPNTLCTVVDHSERGVHMSAVAVLDEMLCKVRFLEEENGPISKGVLQWLSGVSTKTLQFLEDKNGKKVLLVDSPEDQNRAHISGKDTENTFLLPTPEPISESRLEEASDSEYM